MNDLTAQLKTRILALLTGVEYDDAAGGKISPSVHLGALPPKRSGTTPEQDFPFVVIRALLGKDNRQERTITVRLICGSYSDSDIEAGVWQSQDLANRLLALQKERGFAPYRLDLPVEWRSGDGEEGNQPHPYYFIKIDLRFKAPPLADIN